MLLSLLQVMFAEHLVDRRSADAHAQGLDWLAARCAPFTPESTAETTGIDPDAVRRLARDLAGADGAAVYGRIGTCAGRSGTLTSYLIDAVNLCAGNLDVPGGSVFGEFGFPGERWVMRALGAVLRYDYRRNRSRIGGFGNMIRTEPATMMAAEMTTPGERQIRALIVSAGNPVLSVPNGDEIRSAMGTLELSVALDFYLTETSSACDYVLPTTTMYEREDFPLPFQTFHANPFRQATEAVIAPARPGPHRVGDHRRPDARMATRTPLFAALGALRASARLLGRQLSPRPIADLVIRIARGRRLLRCAPRRAVLHRPGRRIPARAGGGRSDPHRRLRERRRISGRPNPVAAQ